MLVGKILNICVSSGSQKGTTLVSTYVPASLMKSVNSICYTCNKQEQFVIPKEPTSKKAFFAFSFFFSFSFFFAPSVKDFFPLISNK